MAAPTDFPGANGTHAASAVADLLRALPDSARRLVHLAAGLGQAFDSTSLAVVSGHSLAVVLVDLRPVLEAGLLSSGSPPMPAPLLENGFAFRVPVEEVYGLIPAAELPALHLRIGRRLLAHDGEPQRALHHIGRGARLLEIAHEEAQRQLGLQQRLASLGTLFAGVAHEIKNPLNFINNFAELSVTLTADLAADLAQVRGLLDPESASRLDEILGDLVQNLSKIRVHGVRADAIVRGMLEQARGRAGQARDVDLNALVQAYARAAAQGRDDARSPALSFSFDEAVGTIHAVPEEIGRVVLNLVSNALYAAEAQRAVLGDGLSPAVRVSTLARPRYVEIKVRDNGAGIPSALRSRVFTPFFTTKPAGEGTGLGLSLSREIVVHSHGGDIAFDSEDGVFTEFVVTLPRQGTADVPR
jgi:signal transduction histidine kinase